MRFVVSHQITWLKLQDANSEELRFDSGYKTPRLHTEIVLFTILFAFDVNCKKRNLKCLSQAKWRLKLDQEFYFFTLSHFPTPSL